MRPWGGAVSRKVLENTEAVLQGYTRGFALEVAPTPAGTVEVEWATPDASVFAEVGETKLSITGVKDDAIFLSEHIDFDDTGALADLWERLNGG